MIKVDNDYYIQADPDRYIVMKYQGKSKKGEDAYKTLSYHSSLKNAIEYIIKYKQREFINDNNVDLKEALDQFEKINKEMYKKIK